jgi:hypothetical protein
VRRRPFGREGGGRQSEDLIPSVFIIDARRGVDGVLIYCGEMEAV